MKVIFLGKCKILNVHFLTAEVGLLRVSGSGERSGRVFSLGNSS